MQNPEPPCQRSGLVELSDTRIAVSVEFRLDCVKLTQEVEHGLLRPPRVSCSFLRPLGASWGLLGFPAGSWGEAS